MEVSCNASIHFLILMKNLKISLTFMAVVVAVLILLSVTENQFNPISTILE